MKRYEPFKVHLLNEAGLKKALQVQEAFEVCLATLDGILDSTPGDSGERIAEFLRCRALVVTKLQEASHFAKRAVAVHEDHQEGRR